MVGAGEGDDTVMSRDGEADEIDCGAGQDTVHADAVDTLTGCENAKVA
jgi:Ca2+-binding RTX toxin-like protein